MKANITSTYVPIEPKGKDVEYHPCMKQKLLKEIQSILREGRTQARLIDTNDYGTWEMRMRKKNCTARGPTLKKPNQD